MEQVLSQIIPLAVNRAGGLVWEYYFRFDGGVPPWTSAMSQGTGIEALTRAYRGLTQASELPDPRPRGAAGVHRATAGRGAACPRSLGARYVQYTFAPHAPRSSTRSSSR